MSKLTRWDPFTELTALQKQFFGDDWFTPSRSATIPTTDVYTKDDKELVVEAHLPNFSEKDIDVHVEDGALVIQAESHERDEDKGKKYVVRESARSFYRRIQLPDGAAEGDIAARMEDGILHVTVPLKKLPAPRKIAVTGKKSK